MNFLQKKLRLHKGDPVLKRNVMFTIQVADPSNTISVITGPTVLYIVSRAKGTSENIFFYSEFIY